MESLNYYPTKDALWHAYEQLNGSSDSIQHSHAKISDLQLDLAQFGDR